MYRRAETILKERAINTMSNVAELDARLNEMVLAGKAMEAFEEFYAEDVVMQENSEPPIEGKDANRKREMEFFDMVEEFHGAKLLSSAVNGDVTFSEWEWDMTLKGVGRVKLSQVAVRRWRDGKVARERFYYNK